MWEPPDWNPVTMKYGDGLKTEEFRAVMDAYEAEWEAGVLRAVVEVEPVETQLEIDGTVFDGPQ
jgi:hypothetical protein